MLRRTTSTSLFILLIIIMVSCKITSHIERKQYSSKLAHVPREVVQQQQQATLHALRTRLDQDTIRQDSIKPASSIFDPANFQKDMNGKLVASIQAKEVSVVARTRILAERDGKVTIDFIITMPRELQGAAQSILITPMLHRADSTIALEPLQVRGGLFNLLQERNYWRYQKYREVLFESRRGILSANDSAELKKIFEEYVNFPYLDRARFDSIANKKEEITFYYTQSVPVVEGEKKVSLTLQGQVNALDGSQYILPPNDTISFNVSTMLFFVDNETRYKTQIIEKFAVVNDRNYLSFPLGKSAIIDTLGDNKKQLGRIKDMMDQMMLQHDFYIDTITLTAAASPEGRYKHNEGLAEKRAFALENYLKTKYDYPELDTLLNVRWIGENWTELRKLIARDQNVAQSEAILEIIDHTEDPDKRENLIAKQHKEDYQYIRENLYPLLRTVDFKYNLRRIGMIKDTVHTTIIDSAYMNAVEELKARRYKEAATVLLDYRDLNAAVLMLSLGYDRSAYDVLHELAESPMINYLRAIVCARLGKIEDGLANYKKACDVDDSWEFRGRLDPEISAMLSNESNK